jgi:hypothetical protein
MLGYVKLGMKIHYSDVKNLVLKYSWIWSLFIYCTVSLFYVSINKFVFCIR